MEREEGNIEENLSEKFKKLKLKSSRQKRAKPTLKITQIQTQEEEEEEKTKNDIICKFKFMIFWCWFIRSLNFCLGKPSPLESKLEVSSKQEEYDPKYEYFYNLSDSFKNQAEAIFNGFGDDDFFEHEHRVSMMHGHLNSMYKTYEKLEGIEQYLRLVGELFAKELISIKEDQMRAEEVIKN